MCAWCIWLLLPGCSQEGWEALCQQLRVCYCMLLCLLYPSLSCFRWLWWVSQLHSSSSYVCTGVRILSQAHKKNLSSIIGAVVILFTDKWEAENQVQRKVNMHALNDFPWIPTYFLFSFPKARTKVEICDRCCLSVSKTKEEIASWVLWNLAEPKQRKNNIKCNRGRG